MTVATTMAITITLIVVIIISVGRGLKINATVLVYKPEDAIVRSIHFLAEAFLVNIGIIQGYVGLYRDLYGYIGLYRVM